MIDSELVLYPYLLFYFMRLMENSEHLEDEKRSGS